MSRRDGVVAMEKTNRVPFSIGYKELVLDDVQVPSFLNFGGKAGLLGDSVTAYKPAVTSLVDHRIRRVKSDQQISINFRSEPGPLYMQASDMRVHPPDDDSVFVKFVTNKIRGGGVHSDDQSFPSQDQSDYSKSYSYRYVMDSNNKERATEEEQVVNPWAVSVKNGGKIDYDKLIDKFGCQRIEESLINRVQRLTCRQPHVFLRRGVFFAHRDFNEILDCYERGNKFYLYTGRGPSSESLHLGHLIPFMFTKYLQDAFKVPLVIQITDDEKCIWKNLKVPQTQDLGRENVKDIIACGFDVTKTFIFSDFDTVGGQFYKNMVSVSKCVTINKAMATFGFSGDDPIGKISFPPVQAVPSFPSSFPHLFPDDEKFPCLIPCAIDQDPYFRMTRDVAPRLGYSKPALIESSFFPALRGNNGKMSASDTNSAIYMNDSAEDIKRKINGAVSGGQDNMEDQKKYGANLEEDIPFKYLSFFLEDDAELEHIKKEYGEGRMLTGEVKKRLTQVLTEIVEKHRRARAAVTDEMVNAFMAVRPLPSMFE